MYLCWVIGYWSSQGTLTRRDVTAASTLFTALPGTARARCMHGRSRGPPAAEVGKASSAAAIAANVTAGALEL